MTVSKRFSVVQKEDLTLDLEYTDSFAILHLPYLRLTKETLLDLIDTVKRLYTFVTDIGYDNLWCAVAVDDNTVNKLAKRVGFHYLDESSGLHVYEYSKEGVA